MNDARTESDFALILAKAAGLSWPTAKQICILRRKAFRILPSPSKRSPQFRSLATATAQRLVRFYNERHSALADFQRLAQQSKRTKAPCGRREIQTISGNELPGQQLGCPALGLDQLAIDQALGDLHRVERRALAQIVGNTHICRPLSIVTSSRMRLI